MNSLLTTLSTQIAENAFSVAESYLNAHLTGGFNVHQAVIEDGQFVDAESVPSSTQILRFRLGGSTYVAPVSL